MIRYDDCTPLCDLLTEAGYGYRRNARNATLTIYRLTDGRFVRRGITCLAACDWLKQLAGVA